MLLNQLEMTYTSKKGYGVSLGLVTYPTRFWVVQSTQGHVKTFIKKRNAMKLIANLGCVENVNLDLDELAASRLGIFNIDKTYV